MKRLLILLLLAIPLHADAQINLNDFQVEMRAESDAPDQWKRMSLSQVDPTHRLIWIRVRLNMSEADLRRGIPLGLQVFAPASYEAWVNGTFIGRNGTPGQNRETEIPGRLESEILISDGLLQPGSNELILRMSGFLLPGRLNAPIQFVRIGEYRSMPATIMWQNVFRLMAGGALLLGAVYFGALFVSNRRDTSSLLLTLLTLSVLAQLVAETSRLVFNYLYPFHILRLQAIAGFSASSTLLLVAYLAHKYVRYRWRLWAILSAIPLPIVMMAVPSYDGKTYTAMLVGLLASGVLASRGAREKAQGAKLLLVLIVLFIGFSLIYPRVFLDLTYYLVIAVMLFVLFFQQVVDLRRIQSVQQEVTFRSAKLELELLRQQIQPHFLMNTLTALCEWVESDPAVGVKMIEALGDELRSIATMGEASTVPLAQEIELCRHYLRVMGFRRDQRFSLSTDCQDMATPVPPAIFHTLIENAFTHNKLSDRASFFLSASRTSGGRWRYELRSPLTKSTHTGIAGKGHAYVQGRLRHAFGEDWHFSTGMEDGQWVDRVEVPMRMACT